MLVTPDMLYYSHVNEDNTVERMLLDENRVSVVIAVAGSGERVLALMDNMSVDRVIAVDVNRDALMLLELKVAALRTLNVKHYLRFIGHQKATSKFRKDCFQKIATDLTDDCRRYWQHEKKSIREGIMYCGHFERFLASIRPFVIFFLGTDFLRILTDPAYTLTGVTRIKWRLLASTFSKKWIYRMMGNRDEAFLGRGADVRIIPQALSALMSNGQAGSSFIAHFIFKGHLRDMLPSTLPPSLQENVLSTIRKRLLRKDVSIEFRHSDLLKYLKGNRIETPAFYSLSDILSFENQDYLADVLENIPDKVGSVIVVRSFLRNRLSMVELKELVRRYHVIRFMDEHDRSGMYQVMAIER